LNSNFSKEAKSASVREMLHLSLAIALLGKLFGLLNMCYGLHGTVCDVCGAPVYTYASFVVENGHPGAKLD
jgi:hypothetical protein